MNQEQGSSEVLAYAAGSMPRTAVGRYLRRRPNLHRVLANSSWLALDRVIRMGMGLVVGAWVARYLSPEGFGLLNYAQAFVGLFAAFATLGLDGIVVRDIVRDPTHRDEILGTATLLKFVGGILTVAVTVAAISVIRPGQGQVRLLVGLVALSTVFQSLDTIDFWFQSQVQSKYVTYARNTAFLIVSGIKVAMILSRASVAAFAWAILAEMVLGSLGLAWVYRLTGGHLSKWRFSAARARSLLADSWPLILSSLTVLLFMQLDQIMLAQLTSYREAGLYTAALRLVQIWAFIPQIILVSVYPTMVLLRSQGEGVFEQYSQRLFTAFLLASIGLAVGIAFFSTHLISLLFGKEYITSHLALTILSFGCIFTWSGAVRAQVFIVNNHPIYHTYSALLGLAVLVPLNLFMIPRYGGNGAAISTVVCYGLTAVATSYIFPRLRYIGSMQARAFLLRWGESSLPTVVWRILGRNMGK